MRISDKIKQKLAERNISRLELEQCFCNIEGKYLEDIRAEHKTNPTTKWFVSETDKGRRLKVMFVPEKDGIDIKSAYEATEEIYRIYRKYAHC
jgi:hypothetical protein